MTALDAEEDADLAYVQERVPAAIERTATGVERIREIVTAMREFGHAGSYRHDPSDFNRAIQSVLTVARNEYKYVADVETDLGDLPPVACNIGEVSQVILNLIVNAAHAIEAAQDDDRGRGTIRIRTGCENGIALVEINDTGTGIPAEIRERIFDPFFTTKETGKGTGQGLAISRSIVVDKHHGTLTLETEPGTGTTFTIRVPITDPRLITPGNDPLNAAAA
jgi:signal transduction histidine kinase